MRLSCGKNRLIGRSGEAQTRGLRIPNAARYQLRYTPIVIKLWSCKWSNLWSNTFLTAIFCFPYRPKIARLKGFRRLAPINVRNAVYAPKPGAIPTSLYPDIQFLPLYHGGRENQRFFCLWSFMWSKLLLCRFRQSGKIPQVQASQGFAAFRLAPSRIPPRHSQTKRATICATPRCSVLKAGVSRKTYYTPEGEKMSSVGACKNALTNPAQYGTVNAQTRNSTIRARLPG